MKIYVHLWYSLDPKQYSEGYEKGLSSDRSPYGYHHAAASPQVSITFSQSHSESRISRALRLALKHLVGGDLIHLFRNRALADAADVIWAHTEYEALALLAYFWLFKPGHRQKFLTKSLWLQDDWPHIARLKQMLFRFFLQKTDVMVYDSRLNLAREGERFALKRQKFFPFCISAERYPLRPIGEADFRSEESKSPIQIFSAGNDRDRDWMCLIQAFGNDAAYQVRVASNQKIAGTNNLPSNFDVRPTRTIEEIIAEYHRADIVVIPLKENTHASGISVLLEAVTQGRPVVVGNTGGLDDYFTSDEIWFYAKGDAAGLKFTVEEIMRDDKLRHSKAIRAQERFKQEDYSSKARAARLVQLSHEIIAAE